MRQSRTSLASASVDRRTGLPKPICHSFAGCADRHASISRKLSRYVSWANAIARYCSVHGNVCTEWSPRYRATIRVNVLQGRQSISCENSVFPAFMGRPSPEKGRGNRRQLQIDTTENRRKAIIGQRLRSSSFALLRTAVVTHSKTTLNRKAREMGIAVPRSQKLTDATACKAISHDFAVSDLKTHAETPKPPVLLFAPACQFPIGEPRQPGFRLCSAQTPLGRPYCDQHYGLCYIPRFAQTS